MVFPSYKISQLDCLCLSPILSEVYLRESRAAIDEESLWEMNAGGGGLAIGEAVEWRSGAPAKLGVGKLSRETARKRGRDVMVIH
ncbi:hypothetical protein CBS147345_8104 [Aspergillus niger]|nr:hypothetical protein CBS147345_8104 [Aspergillus niger]